jgi:RES domain-containing protein
MELIAYRCAAWETPFWSDPNPLAGRYNRAGDAPATYLGLHPLTPWAEYLRANNLSTDDDLLAVGPPTWAVRVIIEPDDIAELSFERPHPLAADELVDDDYSACQAFAAALRADPDAPKAIVAPSAALPGTRNLVLLAPRVIAAYLPDPIDPLIDTPAASTSVRGRAPLNLRDLVHHRGTGVIHPGLAAWQGGNEFELLEPVLGGDEIAAAGRSL